jgi:hypothetical protein
MVSKNIKIATKNKFKPKVAAYKKVLKENLVGSDLKYFKQQTNLSILDAKLKVLYEKGMFKDPENAKKIIRKYQGTIKLANNIFLSKTNQLANSKIIYNKDPKIKDKLFDAYVKEYSKEIRSLAKKGLEVNFVEEINPIIKSFLRKIENKYKINSDKANLN